MAYDAEFIEGFDKYGPPGIITCNGGATTLAALLTSGEWTTTSGNGSFNMVAGLSGPPGQALKLISGTTAMILAKTLPGNYARLIGGVAFSSDLNARLNFVFLDGATAQFTLDVATTGAFELREGDYTSTVLATSAESVTANTAHVLEWDITFNHSVGGGAYKIYLDGVLTSLSNAAVRTAYGTTNDYVSAIRIQQDIGSPYNATIDHFYLHMFLSGGSGDTPLLNNPVVETQFPTGDSAVAWTPQAHVLGQDYRATVTTSAPGANQLALRQFTPVVNQTINSIGIVPQATSAGAKYKGVIYSDSAGAPNSLLSSGTEVVGAVSGTGLTLPLVTPQALAGGTPYWIGYITDTSVVISQVDATTTGEKASNTYTSGAPATAPAMTSGQPSWEIWGNCTGAAANYVGVNLNPPLGSASYNQSSTVSQEDLFTFPALSSSAAIIATMAVKAYCERSDAGARTINLQTKSSGTDGTGSNSAISPATSYTWLDSYFDNDPATSAAWANAAALNAATSGISVNT